MKDTGSKEELLMELLNEFEHCSTEGEDDLNNIIVLQDEQGKDVEFEFLDLIEYSQEQYVVLLPTTEQDDTEEDDDYILILKILPRDDGGEEYISVEDEDVLDEIYKIFKEKFKDEFNFIDEV